MCATQMNTSDNPELWDIQLSYWLFSDLRWQCPWLMASSCYFKTSHMMHATYDACVTAHSIAQSLNHKRLFQADGDSQSLLCNHRLPFPTRGNTWLDTHTAWQAVYNDDRRIRFQHNPVLVISAFYAIFWSFSTLLLILSWLNNQSTLTVLHATSKASSEVSKTSAVQTTMIQIYHCISRCPFFKSAIKALSQCFFTTPIASEPSIMAYWSTDVQRTITCFNCVKPSRPFPGISTTFAKLAEQPTRYAEVKTLPPYLSGESRSTFLETAEYSWATNMHFVKTGGSGNRGMT